MIRRFIPLSIPNFEGNESKYVLDAVEQGWVSTGGAYISRFEEMLRKYLGTGSVAACQSGTAAIHLSLVEAGVRPGDLVIVPALTFIAAVNPVRYQFASPVFMDCDDSLCMDPRKLRRFCEDECQMDEEGLLHRPTGKKVKAVIVVHVFGNMADMEQIMEIAGEFRLIVIEDATEALGTYYTEGAYKGKYAGTIGDFGTYSFNGNKIITTGGGGAVTAKDTDTTSHMRYLSTQAKDDPVFYVHDEVGYNYRMTNLQAAVGVAQMEMLEEFIHRKQKNYEHYQALLSDEKRVKLLGFREGTRSNRWFYSLQFLDPKCRVHEMVERLQEKGVQTRAIWGLIHEQKPYKGELAYDVVRARQYALAILNIPSTTQLTTEEISYSIQQIRDVLDEIPVNGF